MGFIVGACTFPEYTFQGDADNAGGLTSSVSSGGALTGGTSQGGTGFDDSSASPTTTSAGNAGEAGGESLATNTTLGSTGAGGGTSSGGGPSSAGSTSSAGGTGGSSAGDGGTGGSLIDMGACNNDQQCTSAQCDAAQCRPPHCGSGVMDGDEADTDCGGPNCRGCAYGRSCQLDRDCASGICGPTGTCAPSLRVRCSCNPGGACDLAPEQVRVALQFENVGPEAIALERLTFHYYYSAETMGAADSATCNAVNLQGGSCDNLLLQARATGLDEPQATREIRLLFAAGEIPSLGMTGAVEFTISGNPPYDRANDYSFQGVESESSGFSPCESVIVTDADGVAIWGLPPAP